MTKFLFCPLEVEFKFSLQLPEKATRKQLPIKTIKFIIFEYFIAVNFSARFQEVGFSWQKVS